MSDFDDDDAELEPIESDPNFIAAIAEARRQAAEGKTVSHEELKKQLGIE